MNRRWTVSDDTERAGLGKIVYDVDEENGTKKKPSDEKIDNADVQEASEESFPASDAPGYAGGTPPESS
jgi:hypothetical protein